MSAPRRILVTGAAGFVGTAMLVALRGAFPESTLIAATRGGEKRPDADEVEVFDLLERSTIPALIAAARPDAVVHLAALSAVSESFGNPDAVWAANVDGTRALAAAILSSAPGCILLHASSAEVYGLSFRAGTPLDETAALRPANPYAASKAAADLALGEMALRGLRVIRMRPANHTGPGQDARFALPAFARQVARIEAGLQEPVMHTGALDRWRDFLDVRDVCRAYALALGAADRLPSGTVFNLGSGRLREMSSVVADLLRMAGVVARVEIRPEALRPIDLPHTALSAEAARSALDWSPTTSWTDTLAGVLDYWRQRERRA